jgi:hypothetical protein
VASTGRVGFAWGGESKKAGEPACELGLPASLSTPLPFARITEIRSGVVLADLSLSAPPAAKPVSAPKARPPPPPASTPGFTSWQPSRYQREPYPLPLSVERPPIIATTQGITLRVDELGHSNVCRPRTNSPT